MNKLKFIASLSLLTGIITVPSLTSCNKNQPDPGPTPTPTVKGHALSSSTKVEKATISLSKSRLTDTATDTVKITIKNTRASDITDANLTITINSINVNVKFDTSIPAGSSIEKEYSIATIQALFPQYAIQEKDAIKFTLVRSGAYEVKDNQLYKFDELGVSSLVLDEDLEKLSAKDTFLVKDTNSNDLFVSEKTFPAFIDSCNVANATRDLYFVGGTFFNEGHGAPALTTLNIHGLLKNDKQTRLATLRVYRDYVSQEYNEGLSAGNIKFNLYNLNVQGRDGCRESGRNDYQEGMMCPNLNATNCYFSGAYTLWYGHSVFNNCTFDSTKTYKMDSEDKIKNNYPMYLYGGDVTAEFKKCTFESIGKSLKVYSDGALTKDVNALSLDDCEFNLYPPNIEGHTEYTMSEVESPINIDASLSKNCDFKYKVTIKNNCTVNQYWIDHKPGVSNNKLYWAISAADPDKTTFARNILINGERIVYDQVPNT